MRKQTILLFSAICLLGFTLRFSYITYYQLYNYTRFVELERAAASLARDGFLGNIYSASSGRSAILPPLYAGFLAGIYYILGWDTVAGRFAQELFAIAATMIGICLLPPMAKKARLPAASGWVAAVCMAVLPINLWVETSGAWEQPYAALGLLGLLWAFCDLRDRQWNCQRTVIMTGVLFGVIALLTPALLPAGVLMLIIELMGQKKQRKQVIVAALLLLSISSAMVIPWVVRNYYAFGGFVPIKSNFGFNLALGNNPYAADGFSYITVWDNLEHPVARMNPLTNPEEKERLLLLGEVAYMREKQETAARWIKENPGEFAGLTIKRFAHFWFPPAGMWLTESPTLHLKSLMFGLIGVCMFCGLFRLRFLRHPTTGLLAAVVLGPSLTYIISFVEPRYRYPVFGLSTLIACDFVLATGRRWLFKPKQV